MLWHFTAEFAAQGDVGRVTDDDIADAVMWTEDPSILIDALVKTGWVDKSDEYRLLIHDWHDHADEAVRKKLIRAGSDFAAKGTTRKRAKPTVYFIEASETKRIKIGYTDGDPGRRLMDMQTSCPERLVLLATMPGSKGTETNMHRKFSQSSITGEWFTPTVELMAFIDGLTVSASVADNGGQSPPRAEGLGRASGDVSVYKESSLQPKPEKPAPGIVRQSFAGFWSRWCELTKRKQRESFACQAWISVVEFETEQAAMACLERYGASDEVQRGIVSNPDRWLYDQARDKFAGEWQAKNGNGTAERKPTKSERVTEIFLQNMADKARREKA